MWESVLSAIAKANAWVNGIVWGWPVIILILGTGLLLSVRTRFLQLHRFGDSLKSTILPTLRSIGKKQETHDPNAVTPFEAFSAAISGTVGTGNIIGVVSAILTGGPGAVFWMWVSAFFGMVTNYSENVLGLYYRKRDENGVPSGGAFYYIAYGLKWKWLGYVAAVFCMLAAIGMSGVQTNKISGTISGTLEAWLPSFGVKLGTGIVVALLAALIIIGGIKRIGKVTALLVPFMSLLFMVLALVAILAHASAIPGAFGMIFKNAFSFSAAGGGIFGYAFARTIKKGMARGVFSNEAGLGSSVVAHAASETKEPVKQGLWGVFEVFFDTFIICTLTALMMLTTVDLAALTGRENDSAVALSLFSQNFGAFGTVAIAILLPLFAFSTILAWSYYGEKATEFCFGGCTPKTRRAAVTVFKVVYVLLIVAAAMIESDLLWDISDTCNGLMAVPNLIALILMSGTVVKITRNYYDRKKGVDIPAMRSFFEDTAQ